MIAATGFMLFGKSLVDGIIVNNKSGTTSHGGRFDLISLEGAAFISNYLITAYEQNPERLYDKYHVSEDELDELVSWLFDGYAFVCELYTEIGFPKRELGPLLNIPIAYLGVEEDKFAILINRLVHSSDTNSGFSELEEGLRISTVVYGSARLIEAVEKGIWDSFMEAKLI